MARSGSHGEAAEVPPAARSPAWCNQTHGGKVSSIALRVSCEQTEAGNRGMGANIEIRHRRRARTSALTVAKERLSGEKRCLIGQCIAPEISSRQRLLELFNASKSDGYLGIDEWIYDQDRRLPKSRQGRP